MNGWIKLDRGITEHWIFQDADYFRAWITILLMANYEDRTILIDKKPTLVKKGSFYTSITKLAERFGWSRKRTVHFLEALEGDGMVTTRVSTRGTTLTLVNYEKYQGEGDARVATHDPARDTGHVAAHDPARDPQQKKERSKENTNARTRASGAGSAGSFRNFDERHTDYDALFASKKGLVKGAS